MKKNKQPGNKNKITHIKMWIGPRMLPNQLVVQKEYKTAPDPKMPVTYITQQKYQDNEKMSYEIDNKNIDKDTKQLLEKTQEQYHKDHDTTDGTFVVVNYQKTLIEECKKFAENGENLIFIYDSSWFDNNEKKKMNDFLKTLPANCYAVDGKDVLESISEDKSTKIKTSEVNQEYIDKVLDSDEKKVFKDSNNNCLLLQNELFQLFDETSIEDKEKKFFLDFLKEHVKDECLMSDIVKCFNDIKQQYIATKDQQQKIKSNEIVPMYSIGNIVDFYRMLVLAQPKKLVEIANKQKKKNQQNLNFGNNSLLYHDLDIIFNNTKNDIQNNKQQPLIFKTKIEMGGMWDGPDKIENGLMLSQYDNNGKNVAIETLFVNFWNFYNLYKEYQSKHTDQQNNKINEVMYKLSIFEFLCMFHNKENDLYMNEHIYPQKLTTTNNFPMFFDENHRSWLCYSKDVSKTKTIDKENKQIQQPQITKDDNTKKQDNTQKTTNTNTILPQIIEQRKETNKITTSNNNQYKFLKKPKIHLKKIDLNQKNKQNKPVLKPINLKLKDKNINKQANKEEFILQILKKMEQAKQKPKINLNQKNEKGTISPNIIIQPQQETHKKPKNNNNQHKFLKYKKIKLKKINLYQKNKQIRNTENIGKNMQKAK